jgi:hypothetical protein
MFLKNFEIVLKILPLQSGLPIKAMITKGFLNTCCHCAGVAYSMLLFLNEETVPGAKKMRVRK